MKMKGINKKIVSALASVVLAVSCTASVMTFADGDLEADLKRFDDKNQQQIVYDMGAGINLGNQFEAVLNDGYPSETAWGNPVITKELIKQIHDSGFNTIRLPVSYFFRIGEGPDYTVEEAWLNRIQEVVDYAYELGMYVIINMHGDGYYTIANSWLLLGDYNDINPKAMTDSEYQAALQKEAARVDAMVDKYERVWTQVANTFKDYDEHIIFESMNEMQSKQTGTAYAKIFYPVLNRLNQSFVDTVRKTGSNNAKRWLLIPGWWAEINKIVNDDLGFEIPTDTFRSKEIPSDENRIFLSIHFYEPSSFCLNEDAKVTTWGTNSDYSNIETQFKLVHDKFISKGYPIIIGEYGAVNKSSFDPANTTCRHDMYKAICESANKYGLVPIAWDNGYTGDYGLGLFDRNNATVKFQQVINGIMEVYNPDKVVDVPVVPVVPSDPNRKNLTNPDGYNTSKNANVNADGSYDGYIQTIVKDTYNFADFTELEVTFTVDGDVTDDTPVFNFQPFTSSYGGWQDTLLTIGDCELNDGVYTGKIPISDITAHLGLADTYGINISYVSAEPDVALKTYTILSDGTATEPTTGDTPQITEFDAVVGFADGSWTFQDWSSSVKVTGNGTYSITVNTNGQEAMNAVVFVIDLLGAQAGFPNISATLDSIVFDGKEYEFDASKIAYGDIEGKGNYRIDIYNEYGPTKNDPGVNIFDIYFSEYMTLTFTVSGMDLPEQESTTAESDVPNTDVQQPTTDIDVPTTNGEESTTGSENNAFEPTMDSDPITTDVSDEPTRAAESTDANNTSASSENTYNKGEAKTTTVSNTTETTNTVTDRPVNTGAAAAVSLTAFMLAGVIGAVAVKKRKM